MSFQHKTIVLRCIPRFKAFCCYGNTIIKLISRKKSLKTYSVDQDLNNTIQNLNVNYDYMIFLKIFVKLRQIM